MTPGFDLLQTLRSYCRDEAAYRQICLILEEMAEASTQSEAHYRAMLDASPDLMFRISGEGIYLDFNGNEFTKASQDSIVGKHLADVLPPNIAELCLQAIEQAIATGTLQTCEYQLSEPSGLRAYEARVVVCGDREVLWIVQDVTQRKHIEAELRASEERMHSFFEATFETVIIHDYDRILDVNPAGEALFGYTYDEMINMPVLNLAEPSARDRIRQQWRSVSSTGHASHYESVGIRKDGSTFIGAVSVKSIQFRGRVARVASIRDITQRKQSEQAILQSEARNRALVEAFPDLIFRIHRDGTYLDCKADENLLIPAEELIGKTVYESMPRELAEQRMAYVHQALASGQPQNFEYQMRLSTLKQNPTITRLYRQMVDARGIAPEQADLRSYEARVVVSGDDETIVIVRDITERKLTDEAVRLSQEKFAKAFHSSPNAMTLATLKDGRLVDVNEAFYETFGYSREETLQHTVHEINFWVNPSDRARMVEALLQQGSVRNQEYQFRTKSGDIRVVLFSAEIIDIQGQPCLLDVMADITERKRTEERDRLVSQMSLRIRESLDLQQILNTAVDEVRQFLRADRVTIGHDAPGTLGKVVAESVTPGYRSMLNVEFHDSVYINEVIELFSDRQVKVITSPAELENYPAILDHFAKYQVQSALSVPILLDNQFFGLLVVHQCNGPRQWDAFEVELLEQLSTQVSIAVQQAKLFQQVRELNADLERKVQERTAQLQQKMEELQELNDLKDEFLNAFSHDLRTPVMGISLVIRNLLNQPGETIPVSRSILDRMVQSSDHQLALIKSLLEAHSSETRGVSLNPELVQLSLLVQIIAEDIEPIVQKNRATLTNAVPEDLPLVNADPVQLRRVFENLITNALHHNPPGVHITIGASVEEDMIRFTIQDDGTGMSQETCDRLFKRYSRGAGKSRHSTGIGLGLYLCRQIITAHGGQIGVTSKPGQGSTFWLTLPLAIPTGANPALTEG
ncbi:PAS domain S-box protein [Leptolyngbya sp. AN02str]